MQELTTISSRSFLPLVTSLTAFLHLHFLLPTNLMLDRGLGQDTSLIVFCHALRFMMSSFEETAICGFFWNLFLPLRCLPWCEKIIPCDQFKQDRWATPCSLWGYGSSLLAESYIQHIDFLWYCMPYKMRVCTFAVRSDVCSIQQQRQI